MAYVSISQPMLKECRCAVANFKGRMTIPKGHFGKTRTLFVCILDAEHMHVKRFGQCWELLGRVIGGHGWLLGASKPQLGAIWDLLGAILETQRSRFGFEISSEGDF